jgi:glycosyltransferase involved in cell wall biosynthesis
MAEDESTIRLLHITTVPESLDFLAGQAEYMRARGFEVHAMSSPGDLLWDFAKREQVEAHAVKMARAISPASDFGALLAMIRRIRSIRPHIVHAHTPKAGLLGTAAALITGVPVRIYHVHGSPFVTAHGLKRNLLMACEVIACNLATRVICVSRSLRELMVQHRLCSPRKSAVLLKGSINGVDAQRRFNPSRVYLEKTATRLRFGIPSDAVVIGFVGRIVRDKGLVELQHAWKALREEYPEAHMLLVGPFEPQDPVPLQIRQELCSDPHVHLVGLDWNTPPLYAAMDIVVLPSYREGLPSVLLEAGAMELPVVATSVPGCIDVVIDGETGILVPPRDAQALAAALKCYLEDPELRHQHGKAGRERSLRDFCPDSVRQALFDEYKRLLLRAGIAVSSVSEPTQSTEVV